MRVLGMISGTSHDGIDVAVVDLDVEGETLRARLEHTGTVPYEPALRRRLAGALPPAPVGFDVVCELDTSIGRAFAAAARSAVAAAPGPVDLVCSHGQTVFHWVEGGEALGTLQLGQPAWVAEATGRPVVSDVRAADLAAGGHGAPLVPVLDRLLLAEAVADGRRAGALNLGGIANLTVCAPGTEPVAWDIGPAGALVDAVVSAATDGGSAFDDGGRLAAAGSVQEPLLEHLLDDPYYALPPPKSTGKELFHLGYVEAALDAVGTRPELPDLVATLTELTARTVARAVSDARLDVLVASGGGVRNRVLHARLAELVAPTPLRPSDDLGVPAGEKEALAFALIGWATAHGLPGNVPSCTGADGPRVLGRVTPAPTGGWLPPAPLAGWPSRLVVEDATR
ncbi:anhydro-N-acetylmuramic acid kinase [Phycicoccus endophyticus]|uniref:Anhydro-N-acetylmuramic acid kinase n=1 Tax=Phycicoccus endophyticus TaxID=1690220 RepID=A0A7G9R1A3_9MICO|nr:anhydro-N-acetylmuramic acid kinase [Phycicoccus endophyticus]NHI18847.1 anhydro-N-acetylmuramic acid kinase [Phycicoccus endophyticus]QNN49378.1 anhydro-N-acetylmuramic acid kinase [Phycicoccus endophyticus]GGL36069.1 anhydro-N-acetylmuramic acid kinase [Phycicoccus endophyticus]